MLTCTVTDRNFKTTLKSPHPPTIAGGREKGKENNGMSSMNGGSFGLLFMDFLYSEIIGKRRE